MNFTLTMRRLMGDLIENKISQEEYLSKMIKLIGHPLKENNYLISIETDSDSDFRFDYPKSFTELINDDEFSAYQIVVKNTSELCNELLKFKDTFIESFQSSKNSLKKQISHKFSDMIAEIVLDETVFFIKRLKVDERIYFEWDNGNQTGDVTITRF